MTNNYQLRNLPDADFRYQNLRGTNFRWAYLNKADFTGADLRGANFSDTDLREADFTGAYLDDTTVFDRAQIDGAYFDIDFSEFLVLVDSAEQTEREFLVEIRQLVRVKAASAEEAGEKAIAAIDYIDAEVWDVNEIMEEAA